MKRFFTGKIQYLAIAAASLACVVAGAALHAQSPNTAPTVVYTASGTFATPQVSGDDTFRLAGEPFSIAVIANSATVPHAHGAGWADYAGLKLKGTVHSGLDPSGVPMTSSYTFLALALGNPNYNVLQIQAPVIVIKEKITISANIHMPVGTMTKFLIHPFTAPASLDPTNATVTYTNGTDSTTLAIQSGTVNAAYYVKK
jgi:hypothetical protein